MIDSSFVVIQIIQMHKIEYMKKVFFKHLIINMGIFFILLFVAGKDHISISHFAWDSKKNTTKSNISYAKRNSNQDKKDERMNFSVKKIDFYIKKLYN